MASETRCLPLPRVWGANAHVTEGALECNAVLLQISRRAVFVVEDMAVDNKLADIAVIGGARIDLVVVLHKDRVLERMPHAAVLVLEARAI